MPNEQKKCCPKCYRPEGCVMRDYCPCHTPTVSKWEERFDEEFPNTKRMCLDVESVNTTTLKTSTHRERIKAFISNLLSSKIDIDEVIGMIPLYRGGLLEIGETQEYRNGRNAGLAEVREVFGSLKQKLEARKTKK